MGDSFAIVGSDIHSILLNKNKKNCPQDYSYQSTTIDEVEVTMLLLTLEWLNPAWGTNQYLGEGYFWGFEAEGGKTT